MTAGPPSLPPPRPPGAPFVRGSATLRGVQGTILLALLPTVVAAVASAGAARGGSLGAAGRAVRDLAVALGVAWATGCSWEVLFARARRRERTPGLLAAAATFALLLPPEAPPWQVAVGMSFGVVFGREVFGGTGMGFLPPAALGATFLQLAYPGSAAYAGTHAFAQVAAGGPPPDALALGDLLLGPGAARPAEASVAAAVLGAAVLLARRVVGWGTLVALPLALVATLALLRAGDAASTPVAALGAADHLVVGSVAFGAVFLAADPTTAPLTAAGRVALGAFAGAAVAVVRVAHPSHPDAVVGAVLFGGVLAPLADQVAIRVAVRRRARRG